MVSLLSEPQFPHLGNSDDGTSAQGCEAGWFSREHSADDTEASESDPGHITE